MNEIVLDDRLIREDLFPFTRTRPVSDIRIGILTIKEKWERFFNYSVVSAKQPDSTIPVIPANIIPDADLVSAIKENRHEQYLSSSPDILRIRYPWHIFQLNDQILRNDFELITRKRKSQPLSSSNKITSSDNIFVEEGVRAEHCFLNASAGPIYLGKNSEIMEGAMIRGPFALCEGAVVKMGATIYGATTVGPYSIVGGEIKNSVILGYSNKAHEGYLGDSVIGEWCNLGAGTSNSNLKNNAGDVRVWIESQKEFVSAGLKCGLLLGDYSRTAVNTSFNTGAVVGVCCNIFGEGLTPKYIPDFSWGYTLPSKYSIDNALRDIRNWKKLKKQTLDENEIITLKHIFEQTKLKEE